MTDFKGGRHKYNGKWTTTDVDPDVVALEKRVAALEAAHPAPPPDPTPDPPPILIPYGTVGGETKDNLPFGPWGGVAMSFVARTSSVPRTLAFAQRGGKGYSAGTGGLSLLSIVADSNGGPFGAVLASASRSFGNPGGGNGWTTYLGTTLAGQIPTVKGRTYWALLDNIDPDPLSNFISANCLWNFEPTAQPTQPGVVWVEKPDKGNPPAQYVPAFDVGYADGTHDGCGAIGMIGGIPGLPGAEVSYGLISGQSMVRHTLNWKAPRTVSAGGVRLRGLTGKDPVIITIGGATATIPSSVIPQSPSLAGLDKGGTVWAPFKLASPVTFASGALQVSCAAGSSFAASPIRADAFDPSLNFPDGHFEVSTNGGGAWKDPYSGGILKLQFYLT